MQNVKRILILTLFTLTGCPKLTFHDFNEFIYLKRVQCGQIKYGLAYLINPNVTKLPLSENDTITINGKYYKNVYVFEDSDLREISEGTKILMGSQNEFGYLPNCSGVQHLRFIKKVSGISIR